MASARLDEATGCMRADVPVLCCGFCHAAGEHANDGDRMLVATRTLAWSIMASQLSHCGHVSRSDSLKASAALARPRCVQRKLLLCRPGYSWEDRMVCARAWRPSLSDLSSSPGLAAR